MAVENQNKLWLETIAETIMLQHPEGEIVVSSGVSPSGTYHLGTLREVLTAEAIKNVLKKRGRAARHIHVVDDLDVFRKVPVGVPETHEQYLGMPLCDVPSPDGSSSSYADFYLNDLLAAASELALDMEIMRAHEKYRSGFFAQAIETSLDRIDDVKKILVDVSGRALDSSWSPVQIIEDGYLKNREFVSIDKTAKEIVYKDASGTNQTVRYDAGLVKLNWRLDWPARWSLLGVGAEPFGRDHATKGGSYDTGKVIVQEIFGGQAPFPVPYEFIQRTGDTKKMSKSAGDTITAIDLLHILPAEVVWFFILRYPADKSLFFDTGPTLIKLVDEFSELLANTNRLPHQQLLLDLCLSKEGIKTISSVPFSHLVASYQAALKNERTTLEVIKRTEHALHVDAEEDVITAELKYIHAWLDAWATDDVKFELQDHVDFSTFSDVQIRFMRDLADKIMTAPQDADGEWFHKAIYDFKDVTELAPKELFSTLYQAIIGKDSGPRAGWFSSLLPKDWLIKRLKQES